MRTIYSLCILIGSICMHVQSADIDYKLEKVIEAYELQGLNCANSQYHDPSLSKVGEFIFENTILSGNNDTSCSTCHIEKKARTDGLPISVGVGGNGEGQARLSHGHGILVPRNSFTLAGRGFLDYKTYFWDGKVQAQDNKWVSPVGNGKELGYHSLLAVAATLPLLARDEFLGLKNNKESEAYVSEVNSHYHQDKYHALTKAIRKKLQHPPSEQWNEFAALLSSVDLKAAHVELSDIGNAIAAFLIDKENCIETKWSQFIKGNKQALNNKEKLGAYLFYGKARCATCHSGDLLSDFSFHSLGVPQGAFGVSILGQDLGRSEISLRASDRFKFKTPSLLKVSETPPYGHNGMFEKLEDIVMFHLNPLIFLKQYEWADDEVYNYGRVLASRSSSLSFVGMLTEEEIKQLIAFVKTL
ncbi:His-Xaa-Ser system-associated MauG-like protein [Pseudoalteromonas sp. Isolate6]|uniref:His-Xaa-Ser system-associated MauG-like protein n=1 Tax=Pseudoalteromonas sp. Isolate6 TaxID=2908527 RepID=UPI001EFD5D40|nr:His-Xaa-Ser system-associated MauG-like protein [Pseudoalteromonas sp. Isolate6]MCG9761830.1 His-Xaa-Ser system-associated MauG-like protein [Pseudoalteromonas sp. Isolate6]